MNHPQKWITGIALALLAIASCNATWEVEHVFYASDNILEPLSSKWSQQITRRSVSAPIWSPPILLNQSSRLLIAPTLFQVGFIAAGWAVGFFWVKPSKTG